MRSLIVFQQLWSRRCGNGSKSEAECIMNLFISDVNTISNLKTIWRFSLIVNKFSRKIDERKECLKSPFNLIIKHLHLQLRSSFKSRDWKRITQFSFLVYLSQHLKELDWIVMPLPLQSHETHRLHYSKNQGIVGWINIYISQSKLNSPSINHTISSSVGFDRQS